MDSAKKPTKKIAFSVPSAKKMGVDETAESTATKKKQDKKKTSENTPSKPKCDKTETKKKASISEKKAAKCTEDQAAHDNDSKNKLVKCKPIKPRAVKKTRSLTEAEYEDIFQSVINTGLLGHSDDGGTGEKEPEVCQDIYAALTQEDGQTEVEQKRQDTGAAVDSSDEKPTAADEGSLEKCDQDILSAGDFADESVQVDDRKERKKKGRSGVQTIKDPARNRSEKTEATKKEAVPLKGKNKKRKEVDGKDLKKKNEIVVTSDKRIEEKEEEGGECTGLALEEGEEETLTSKENKKEERETKKKKNRLMHDKEGSKQMSQGEEIEEIPAEGSDKEGVSLDKEVAADDQEKDEVESVVSEQSINSSLLDMAALEVDQWERPEDLQQDNENTPHASEAEAEPCAETPTIVHKAMKPKHRQNQLAPRKLHFDATAPAKMPTITKEKKKKSTLKSPAAVLEIKMNKKSLKKTRKQGDVGSKERSARKSGPGEVAAEWGTWVQCCEQSCKKWRYLSDIHDPVQVPYLWVCSMNPDTRYNSCETAEQEYDESDHIFTQYTLGSVVWAKMDGFPWWPAIIDTDPDYDVYCEIPNEDSMIPTDYHAVFLDERVTRSWIRKSRIKQLVQSDLVPGSSYVKGHKYKKEVGVAMRKAEMALGMPLQERLDSFGFGACFRNLKTKWTKAVTTKRQPKHRKCEKRINRSRTESPAAKRMKVLDDTSDDGSLSDSNSPLTGYSPDSDLSSQSSHEDHGEAAHPKAKKTVKKKLVVSPLAQRPVKKFKHANNNREKQKKTKKTESATKRKLSKLGHGEVKAKKGKFAAPSCVTVGNPALGLISDEISSPKNDLTQTGNEQIVPNTDSREQDFTESEIPTEAKASTEMKTSTGDFSSPYSAPEEKSSIRVKKPKKKKLSLGEKQKTKISKEMGQPNTEISKNKDIPDSKTLPKEVLHGALSKSEETEVKEKDEKTTSLVLQAEGTSKKKKVYKSEKAKQRDAAFKLAQREKEKEMNATKDTAYDKEGNEQEEKTTLKPKLHKKKKTEVSTAQTAKSSEKKVKFNKDDIKELNTKHRKTEDDSSDKRPKPKSQKFIAPSKLVAEKPTCNIEPSAENPSKTLIPTESKPEMFQSKQTSSTKEQIRQKGGKLSLHKKEQEIESDPVTPAHIIRDPAQDKVAADSDDDDSPLLNHKNQDQFVPSMDSSDDDIHIDTDMMSDDGNITSLKSRIDKVTAGLIEENSDSDCLDIDIEESLPLPSLQQVLDIESKHLGDHTDYGSDPLEIAED